MRVFPEKEEEEELVKEANKLGVSLDECTTSVGLNRAELQRRILAARSDNRNSRLWVATFGVAVASVISAASAFYLAAKP